MSNLPSMILTVRMCIVTCRQENYNSSFSFQLFNIDQNNMICWCYRVVVYYKVNPTHVGEDLRMFRIVHFTHGVQLD